MAGSYQNGVVGRTLGQRTFPVTDCDQSMIVKSISSVGFRSPFPLRHTSWTLTDGLTGRCRFRKTDTPTLSESSTSISHKLKLVPQAVVAHDCGGQFRDTEAGGMTDDRR